MRRLGPCAILVKYGENAYKVELPKDIALSSVFNVVELVAYKAPTPGVDYSHLEVSDDANNLQMPARPSPNVEKVMSSRITKKTRCQIYWEHLTKWQGMDDVEATWVCEIEFKKLGIDQNLIPKEVT